jgi:hypothetical protein
MAIRMTSDITPEFAAWSEARGAWQVSFLPSRDLSAEQAFAAMTLAEMQARGEYESPRMAQLRAALNLGQ